MVQSKATSIAAYLKELPPERRKVVAAVRKVIKTRLPAGYEEAMNWGMITYQVPLHRSPKTCNGQPLMYAALSAQKNNYSLHLMCAYQSKETRAKLIAAKTKSGKKLDMGKACIRFKQLDDLPLDTIGDIVAGVPLEKYLAIYNSAHK